MIVLWSDILEPVDDTESAKESTSNPNYNCIPDTRRESWQVTVEGNVSSGWRGCTSKVAASSTASEISTVWL
jgi:hypothetical protein